MSTELKRHKSVADALQYAADHPPSTDAPIDMPAWELISRQLIDIANNPDPKVKGATARANRARKILFNRLGGRRRAGTAPVSGEVDQVEFVDLTQGSITV